ncbi:MAG TPA: glycosyltransferase, partial [Candidatus Eisenbacteria bacterium]|nr:glycosyltransferase [Candidatus Eisenbacteria bacterium]
TRFPDRARVLFVEPWTLGHRGAIRPADAAPGVRRVSFPFLPLHARSHGLRRAAYAVGSSALADGFFLLQRLGALGLRDGSRKRLALVQNFMAEPFLDALRPDRVVYDMIDAPLHFAPVPPRLVPRWERLLRRADRVIVTSRALGSLATAAGARAATLIGNGVEAARFDPDRVAPASLPGDPAAPVLGYVGSLHSWLDVPLVAALARACPEARVVLVGPAPPETAAALARAARENPNLHWTGPKPYDQVPGIVRAFRVGLIPFRRTPLTEAVNPVKLYEYAAAGVPCVATRFTDEVDAWDGAARVAESPEGFIAEARALLASPPDRAGLLAFARRHDWDAIAQRFASVCLEDAA